MSRDYGSSVASGPSMFTIEHLANGGRENGNLIVTYLQLRAFGVTKDDIKRGLTELQICGFVRLVKEGFRVASGGEPARYAITWQVTFLGSTKAAIPTNDWHKVQKERIRAGQTTVFQVRSWLKEQVAKADVKSRAPATVRQRTASTQNIDSTPQVRVAEVAQVRAENTANIVSFNPQVRADPIRT